MYYECSSSSSSSTENIINILLLNIRRSDLRFFARKILQTCLGVPPTGSCKMRRKKNISPPINKGPTIIEKFEGLSLIDTSFVPIDSPRPL